MSALDSRRAACTSTRTRGQRTYSQELQRFLHSRYVFGAASEAPCPIFEKCHQSRQQAVCRARAKQLLSPHKQSNQLSERRHRRTSTSTRQTDKSLSSLSQASRSSYTWASCCCAKIRHSQIESLLSPFFSFVKIRNSLVQVHTLLNLLAAARLPALSVSSVVNNPQHRKTVPACQLGRRVFLQLCNHAIEKKMSCTSGTRPSRSAAGGKRPCRERRRFSSNH